MNTINHGKIKITRMSIDDLTFDAAEVWAINQDDINELMQQPQSTNPINLPIVALKDNNLVVTNLKHAIAAIWRGDNHIHVATAALVYHAERPMFLRPSATAEECARRTASNQFVKEQRAEIHNAYEG